MAKLTASQRQLPYALTAVVGTNLCISGPSHTLIVNPAYFAISGPLIKAAAAMAKRIVWDAEDS